MTGGTGKAPLLHRIYLLGTGLIGGSLALDLKEKGVVGGVVGSDHDAASQETALEKGILDEALPPVPEVLRECDLIVLAMPVLDLVRILEEGFGDDVLVTDVGSVKGAAVAAWRRSLSAGKRFRYVPGHPIAGDERSGPSAARTGLFSGARVILTPAECEDRDVDLVRVMWEGAGAEVMLMDPWDHDRAFAWVSHMPHMAAYSIIDAVLRRDPELVALSGGGLRDYTRVAASSPRMWADIAVANRENLLEATRSFRDSVDRVIEALEAGDRDGLQAFFEPIARVRRGSL